MASSRGEARSVEPDPPRQPNAQSHTKQDRIESRRQYSPIILVVDVIRLLRGRGVAVSEAPEDLHGAVQAGADLLRRLGVESDARLLTKPHGHTPELIAAAVLMRAAGIEPNAVSVWPGTSS